MSQAVATLASSRNLSQLKFIDFHLHFPNSTLVQTVNCSIRNPLKMPLDLESTDFLARKFENEISRFRD
jgi:hypothetical protein